MIAEIQKKKIIKYCEHHSNDESQLLRNLIDYTNENLDSPQMLCGSQVGNLLQGLILTSRAKKILEIGMFTGYSALKMAEVLPNDGIIHTCENNEQHIQVAKKFFEKSSFGKKIKIFPGKAIDSLEKFSRKTYDICFIDADKNNYIKYFKECKKLIKDNGVILIDNMLWGGEVLNPKDKESKTIAKLAQIINSDTDIHNTMLSIRDGLMLCVKI